MAQHYSRPSRESDPHALPDLETWKDLIWKCNECGGTQSDSSVQVNGAVCPTDKECLGTLEASGKEGWWYWFCLPGCLPDSDPLGPFETEEEALRDAREGIEEEEEEENQPGVEPIEPQPKPVPTTCQYEIAPNSLCGLHTLAGTSYCIYHGDDDDTQAPKSWKVEVVADSSGKWCSNLLRFPTRERAETYARNLESRWTLVTSWRVVPAEEEVNS